MTSLVIQIQLGIPGSGCFDDMPCCEAAGILRTLADRLEEMPSLGLIHGRVLRDAAGRSCGVAFVETDARQT